MAKRPKEHEVEEAKDDAAETDMEMPVEGEPHVEEDKVFCNVPRKFQLRINNHKVMWVEAGAQKLDRSIAEHFYSIANGVTIVS